MENIAEETSAVADSTGAETGPEDSIDAAYDNLFAEDREEAEGITQVQEEQDQQQSESDEETQPEPSEQKTGTLNWDEAGEKYAKAYKELQSQFTKVSQEKAELAKQPAQIDETIQGKVAFFDKLDQAYRSNPEFARAIENALMQGQQQYQQSQYDPLQGLDNDDPVVPYVRQLEQKVQQLEQGYSSYQQDKIKAEGNRQLDSVLGNIKEAYRTQVGKDMPIELENKALSVIAQKGVADPEILSAYLFKDEIIKAERQKIIDDRKAKSNIKKTPTVNANRTSQPESVMDLEEAFEIALKETGGF